MLSDEPGDVARKYGVINDERQFPFRWTFYIDKDGKILEIDKNVNAANDGATCAIKLEKLGVPKK
ncbi:MAG: redoxin domain-containing protein [Verrucomicrobia bacterium]|nr:redoxin domain-containing protein [Verrucomicrobiota bacterium]MDA1087348.1 redoxin domain-containing protein [Verrucomicrobiota bacterium]